MQYKKENRATIFAPYDSLKGFFQMIHEKEKIVVEKRELSEDEKEQLDYQLFQIQKGMMIKVVYEKNDEYIQKEGMVAKIDLEYNQYIQIVNEKIPILKIVELEVKKTDQEGQNFEIF